MLMLVTLIPYRCRAMPVGQTHHFEHPYPKGLSDESHATFLKE
jgi:hypothetical protein